MSRPSLRHVLRDNPDFAAMHDDAAQVKKAWPTVLVSAHRDQRTGQVTFHLHAREFDLGRLRDLLGNVPLFQHHAGDVTTWRFHGRQHDMNRLLAGLGIAR